MGWRAGGKPVVTDKLPSNYLNLGFIANALPDAKFIHLRRDPVDVGFSSLRTLFSHACPYSYDPLDFARHFHQYRRLMDHWRERFADRILDVDYDDLFGDPIGTVASIYANFGIEMTEEASAAIIRTDDESKHGQRAPKHSYSLADYGLTEDQVKERFRGL